MKKNIILGIETSCDDTSIAVISNGENFPEILSFESFSQEQMLSAWGGVVPEIAARNHLDKISPLLQTAITKAKISLSDITCIGVTTYPGLLGPLLTGLNAAKTISMLHKTPIIPVNHLYAHLEAIHLSQKVSYPYLGLLVSGGHSIYMHVTGSDEFEILGSTIDDAAGEAFDKGGKLMGLGYPAGRIIDDYAKKGDPEKYEFPIGLRGSKDANLSFSGVKTALRQFLENNPELYVTDENRDNLTQAHLDVCASYQEAIVKALKLKLKYALKKVGAKLPIVVGGGVACNSRLRSALNESFQNVHFVEPKFCTDNGAMIANYALRIQGDAIEYPETLNLDARSRFISKNKTKDK
ncbi:tRNA (adenosine(37)-N6)-threonylcarbamoyltransferase complex transferase subunit TsaD [Bacteriovorax sp. Seq25_V]|uniref:tRNA (adenosine(37)-N6)-threonylcarbamoyltransferase complex transferase subunit TsaD n=1 Tax=Bacteriovorax sp. Seq25_V TaxID=1201288 RepID=UPI000389F705|nr:tRNA (adenosine(37)-N6)-threonylcarbamoyltransferase complex transferase subunit TsaD [Bacteriovorax sp. Seq25_V]EQC47392.1 tRNA threonylcarbamoyl adenosine modification protein YgjD [Bacteriovorax sp. Seq25_V]